MRALIVDDERLARGELRRLLGRHPEIEIVGEAGDKAQARAAIEALQPDLMFLDVQMPEGSGFDLLASLHAAPLVVFITAHDDYAVRAFEVSALDYLLKPIEPRRLAAAVQRVLAQASRIAASAPDGSATRTPSVFESTTQRLQRLLEEELRGGKPTLEHLAARLHMSPRTLHRRLGEEGSGFRRVLAQLRRELAARHLRDVRLPLGEIAFLLGFSEASAFHRAFRRWTGWPPLAYRRAHAAAATSGDAGSGQDGCPADASP
jgi:DNA-binding LytR/AlgR family response regulator